MLTDNKYLDLRGRRCVEFGAGPKYLASSNITAVYLFTIWHVIDHSRKRRKEADCGNEFLEDILFFGNKYSNITIALAWLSGNKELARAFDDLYVFSY